ncbi:hypothetical protein B0H15DRAFT_805013 [Mycena belliarum]|uniref:Uncharacterized protein n=1 Tax=Mycena belliarum TaxID=1033014 RepID=A0AAD6TVR6_9AGAR|nr:hypothetical protein B0H15DRAFT_805013 [Mycena belliae]
MRTELRIDSEGVLTLERQMGPAELRALSPASPAPSTAFPAPSTAFPAPRTARSPGSSKNCALQLRSSENCVSSSEHCVSSSENSALPWQLRELRGGPAPHRRRPARVFDQFSPGHGDRYDQARLLAQIPGPAPPRAPPCWGLGAKRTSVLELGAKRSSGPASAEVRREMGRKSWRPSAAVRGARRGGRAADCCAAQWASAGRGGGAGTVTPYPTSERTGDSAGRGHGAKMRLGMGQPETRSAGAGRLRATGAGGAAAPPGSDADLSVEEPPAYHD